MATKEIRLGNVVHDVVTGFEGVAVARLTHLNGCVQYCVRGAWREGPMPDEGTWIDAGQLTVVRDGVAYEFPERSQPKDGGPMPGAPKRYRP